MWPRARCCNDLWRGEVIREPTQEGAKSSMPTQALDRLREAGFSFQPKEMMAIETRSDYVVVRLPDDCLAWFPVDGWVADSFRVENRALALLEARCDFAGPRVLTATEDRSTLAPSRREPPIRLLAVHMRLVAQEIDFLGFLFATT